VPRFYWNSYAKSAWLALLDTSLNCRYEWAGSCPHLTVLTPAAEMALMGITQAVSNGRGAMLSGPPGRGKQTMTQQLARMCGFYMRNFVCIAEETSVPVRSFCSSSSASLLTHALPSHG